jgi:hypothetical protein
MTTYIPDREVKHASANGSVPMGDQAAAGFIQSPC